MTYSVVARDEETGCLGVAVQSCVLAVGTRVPAARAGVGAVVVQAGSELPWRSVLLDLMGDGLTAAQAVEAVAGLPGAAESQFAAVGATGPAVAFTGPDCIPEAGHAAHGPVSAQANMVARDTVWAAMPAAYSSAPGDLADRLVAALAAAEREGGDVRGSQSAALLVVGPERGSQSTGWGDDPVIDLRVDDSRDPVGDLGRLLTTARAHRHLIRSGTDGADAVAELRAAAATAPHDPSSLRSAGIGLVLRGHAAEGGPLLAEALRLTPAARRWARLAAERALAAGNAHGATLLTWLDDHG